MVCSVHAGLELPGYQCVPHPCTCWARALSHPTEQPQQLYEVAILSAQLITQETEAGAADPQPHCRSSVGLRLGPPWGYAHCPQAWRNSLWWWGALGPGLASLPRRPVVLLGRTAQLLPLTMRSFSLDGREDELKQGWKAPRRMSAMHRTHPIIRVCDQRSKWPAQSVRPDPAPHPFVLCRPCSLLSVQHWL